MKTPTVTFEYEIPAESVDALESPRGRLASEALGLYALIDAAVRGAEALRTRCDEGHRDYYEDTSKYLTEAREEAHSAAMHEMRMVGFRGEQIARMLTAIGCVNGQPRKTRDEIDLDLEQLPPSWACGSCPGGRTA